MMPWLTVTPSQDTRYPLALRFRYDAATVSALKQEFDGTVRRWNAAERCWLFRRSQFGALCAVFGDRLEVHPDVWCVVYPVRSHRRRPARQRDIWGGSTVARKVSA